MAHLFKNVVWIKPIKVNLLLISSRGKQVELYYKA